MARRQRTNPLMREQIGGRFIAAIENDIGFTLAEASRRLNYANPSTIQAIKQGKVLPDFARLALYKNRLCNSSGAVINLHWLITGNGERFIHESTSLESKKTPKKDDINISIGKLTQAQRSALSQFLVAICSL